VGNIIPQDIVESKKKLYGEQWERALKGFVGIKPRNLLKNSEIYYKIKNT